MNLSKKIEQVFNSGYSIAFQNEVRRSDGEWYSRITWKNLQQPGNQVIKECEWFGFETMEECVDDCLKYLNNKNYKK
jgi:hypothetical protein